MSGLTHDLSFSIWLTSLVIMSSRFTHLVVAGIGISSFLRLSNIPCMLRPFYLPIHLPIDTGVVLTSGCRV